MDCERLPHHPGPTPVGGAEYCVLSCIELEGGLIDRDGVPILAEAIRPDRRFTAADYWNATDACLNRGWIKFITEEDQRADAARWADEPHQAMSENPYRVGSLDFTPQGWRRVTRLAQGRREGRYEARYAEQWECIWNVPGRVSILCVSETVLVQELEKVLAGTDNLTVNDTGSGLRARHTLGEVIGPYSIGPWWVNRFYHAPAGYRLDIAFEPADLHTEAL